MLLEKSLSISTCNDPGTLCLEQGRGTALQDADVVSEALEHNPSEQAGE